MTRAKSRGADAMSMVNPGAAAIDIGSTMHMAAINPHADDNPVRAFGTFTGDLHDMARWFKACGVTSVAMESTGVYWICPSARRQCEPASARQGRSYGQYYVGLDSRIELV